MHYKVLLLASTFCLSLTSIFAQKYESFTMPAKTARVIKNDTIVIKEAKQASGLMVANLPILSTDKMVNCKPVPLAGNKSYFGSMSEYVENYTRSYMCAHDRTLCVVKGRGNTQFSLVDNILQKHNIPKELKYLAVIESALNNNAISPVGAVGPWQFMASTARLMGLTVNKKRDDRKDWYKSTTAAAKYLTYLYGQLNDWLLVVAAYNSGPTPVQRAIQRTGSTNFWDIKKYLPKETQGHVLAFIATASIFENLSKFIGLKGLPTDFSFSKEPTKAPVRPAFSDEELKSMAIVRITEPVNMELLCQELKIEKKLLEKWNPDYDLFLFDAYSSDTYSLRLPKDKLDNFIDRKEYLTKRSKQLFGELSM